MTRHRGNYYHFDMVATENDIQIDFWLIQPKKQKTKQIIIIFARDVNSGSQTK